jgi:hypothetical protein
MKGPGASRAAKTGAGGGARDALVAGPLVRLLRDGRSEHACAAALVLGALRPRDPRVSRALARKLRTAEPPVKPYVREALARQRTDEALAILAKGILGTGVEREQSRLLSAASGSRILPHFDRVLAENPGARGGDFFAIAAGFRTRSATEWLIRHLASGSRPRAVAIYRALRHVLRGAYPRELRRALRAMVAEVAVLRESPGAAVAERLLRALG